MDSQKTKRSALSLIAGVSAVIASVIFFVEFIILFINTTDYKLAYAEIFIPLVLSVVLAVFSFLWGEKKLYFVFIPVWIFLVNLLLNNSGVYTLIWYGVNIWIEPGVAFNELFLNGLFLATELGLTVCLIFLACRRRWNISSSVFLYILLSLFVFACVQNLGILYYGCIFFFLAVLLLILENERKHPDLKPKVVASDLSESPTLDHGNIFLQDVDIPLAVILTIITFGFYGIYFGYTVIRKIRLLTKGNRECFGELICLLFVPFYSAYWGYSRSESLRLALKERNLHTRENSQACLFLGLLRLNIVNYIILQNELNAFARMCLANKEDPEYAVPLSDKPAKDESSESVAPVYTAIDRLDKQIEKLRELKTLREDGTLTEDEYIRLKRDLIFKK